MKTHLRSQTSRPPNRGLAGGLSLDQLLIGGSITLCLLVGAAVLWFPAPGKSIPTEADARILAMPARQLVDFTLTNSSGQMVQRSDLAGQFLVVNFVFTGCSLSCLQVNHRMAEIQKLVADQDDVCLVSLSVDPQSDTPQALASFARQFHADTNRWLFLTGDKTALYSLLEKSFLGPPEPELMTGVPGGFGHTDLIALVDKRGEVRAMVKGLKSSAAREVTDKLAALRKENPPL